MLIIFVDIIEKIQVPTYIRSIFFELQRNDKSFNEKFLFYVNSQSGQNGDLIKCLQPLSCYCRNFELNVADDCYSR